jgi:RES domain-containing protein
VIVWRVIRAAFCSAPADAFSGRGAAETGQRWNGAGMRMAYASSTLSLAILEYLASIGDRTLAPSDLVVVRAVLPKPAPRDETPSLPSDWRTVPPPHSTRAFGNAWIRRGAALAIMVPSVILPAPPSTTERNVLINPLHARFGEIAYDATVRIVLDERLA